MLPAVLLLAVACSSGGPGSGDAPAQSEDQRTTEAFLLSKPTPIISPYTEPPPGTTKSLRDSRLYTPTDPPPKVDTSISGVPLGKIVFDTFRGGYLPLPVATDEIIEDLRDAIPPIYEASYVAAEGGDWLEDSDLVVGYAPRGIAYAYPVKILNFHEIVNDFIGGIPVLASYCPLCASGVVYSRRLDGKELLFGNTSALYESDMVMYDHQTGSYWFQVIGEAVVGELTGKRLTMLPSVTATWGDWKRRYPDTLVLSRDLGLPGGRTPESYERDPFTGYSERVNQKQFAFPVSPERLDDRLPPGHMVFAIQVGEDHKAYALNGEKDWVVNDVVGGLSVVVIGRAAGPSAVAYFNPNSPKDTDGRREESGRGVRELQGK